jgi:hypothetical protein
MVYEKLANIQRDLFVPKGQKNTFGNYNYRSCEDILKAVKPLCEAQKCVLLLDSITVPTGEFNYVVATAKLVDLEDSTEITSTASAREDKDKKGMDAAQISGSCLSYARKYALAGLFCIDNEKDSDATNTHGKEVTDMGTPLPEKVGKKEVEEINKELERTGVDPGKILNMYAVNTFEELTSAQYVAVINRFKKTPSKE